MERSLPRGLEAKLYLTIVLYPAKEKEYLARTKEERRPRKRELEIIQIINPEPNCEWKLL